MFKVGDYVIWYNMESRFQYGIEIVTEVNTKEEWLKTNKSGNGSGFDGWRRATPVQIAKYRCENE